ncbi:MAG: zinc-dependent metalloprotease, partial [Bacteroidia bacterium]
HISGDDGNSCTGDDQVMDTPLQADQTYGTIAPNTVVTDICSPTAPGVMWMNYMNYTDDVSMYMFTAGQKARMWAALNGPRVGILSSTKCVPTSVYNFAVRPQPTVFPNPTAGILTVEIPADFGNVQRINVVSVTGASVMQIAQPALRENRLELDLSELESGVYFIEFYTASGRSVSRVVRN